MNVKNLKQTLYYPAGLLTLLFIPLSYFLASYKSSASNERLLSCPFIPSIFCGPADADYFSNKLYTTIELTGSEAENERVILKGRLLVRALVESQSTTKGIRFKLCDEMKFENLIELLNTFKLEGVKIYLIDEQNIWVMNPPIRKIVPVEYPPIYL